MEGRFGDGVDRAVDLGTGVIRCDTSGVLLFFRVVGAEVRAQSIPGTTPVRCLEEIIPAKIHDLVVVGRKQDRGVPVETVGWFIQRSHGFDILGITGFDIETGYPTHVGVAVQGCVIFGIGLGVKSVPASDRIPVEIHDAHRVEGIDRRPPASIVLETDIHIVGIPEIIANLVDLGPSIGLDTVPGFCAVVGDVDPSVVPIDEVERVMGIDPHHVMIGMGIAGYLFEGFSAIAGNEGPAGVDVYDQLVIGVDRDLAVVEWPEVDPVIGLPVRHPTPCFPLVIRAENAAVFALDKSVHHIGLGPADIDAPPAVLSTRQSLLDFPPGFAGIRGFVQGAARAAAPEMKGLAEVIPSPGIQDAGVGRIHGHIRDTCSRVHVQDLFPGFSPVCGFEHATLLVGSPEMAKRTDVNDVRIGRMNQDLGDVLCLFQSHVFPSFAAIFGFVNTVADAHAVAGGSLAGSNPDDVRMALGYSHRADSHGVFFVEYRIPRHSAVFRFKHTAGAHRGIDDSRIALYDGKIHCAAAHDGRSDGPHFKRFDDFGIVLSPCRTSQHQECYEKNSHRNTQKFRWFHDPSSTKLCV